MIVRRNVKVLFLFIVFCFPMSLLGCSGVQERPLSVAASVPPFSNLLQEVLGSSVKVVNVVKNSTALEDGDLSLKMVKDLTAAQFYFSFHLPLERLLETKKIFVSNRWIRLDLITPPEHFTSTTTTLSQEGDEKGEMDPHFWMSPRRMERALEFATHTLSTLYPQFSAQWEERLSKVKARLEVLGKRFQKLSSTGQLSFLIFHPALGYLAKDYKFRQLALEQEGKETQLRDLIQMIPRIRAYKVRVLFIEQGLSTHLVESLKKALNLKVVVINPFGGDYEAELLKIVEGLS